MNLFHWAFHILFYAGKGKKFNRLSRKKVFALRINPEVMEAVEKQAADEFRSANGQLEVMIAKALRDAGA